MSNRSEKYLAAAKKYKARNENTTPDPRIQEFFDFVRGEEWGSALHLLYVSSKSIQVGHEKGNVQIGYFLGGTGFYLTYRNDGKDVVKEITPDLENVKKVVDSFHTQFPEETSFTEFIFKELDHIAQVIPE